MNIPHVVKLLVPFALGIIISDLYNVHWTLAILVWFLLIASLFTITSEPFLSIQNRKWVSLNIIVLFFVTGYLNIQLNSNHFFENSFSEIYLKDDAIIGEVIDYQEGKDKYNRAIIAAHTIERPFKRIKVVGRFLCYIQKEDNKLREGDVVRLTPNMQLITNQKNPWEFNAERYWKIKGIEHIAFINEDAVELLGHQANFTTLWSKCRNHLIAATKTYIHPNNQGLVVGISLGDKSNLSQASKSQFTNAGIMHVLAVSGMHVGILLGALQFFFRLFKPLRNKRIYLIMALITLWGFAFLTGLSASVSRAVLTFSVLAIGQLSGKKFFNIEAIFGSALLLLIINPYWLFDIGFQLSYLAVIGIALFYIPILRLFHSNYKLINWLWQGLAVGFAAQIGTVPISLYYFHQFPNYFVLSNIGMLFLAAAAFIAALVFFIFHWIPFVVDIIAYLTDSIFFIFDGFVAWINTLPALISIGFTPSGYAVIAIYIGIGLAYFAWKRQRINLLHSSNILICIIFISFIFQRETNKNHEELVVLNHYEKNIILKEPHVMFHIYESSHPNASKNSHFLTHSYATAMGVKVHAKPISKKAELRVSDRILLRNKNEGLYISYYQHNLLLANSVHQSHLKDEFLVIKGNWNKFLPEENVHHNLSKGAFILRP